ncbi:MAG TPA: hypothetical protein G4O07_02240 [Dehalococcoidia bacterium]|nr:hypothetical protein [Dehalococcoidia bacterium]
MTIISSQIVINIDEEKVLADIGYNGNCGPPARMRTLVHEYARNATQLINPAYTHVIRNIDFVVGRTVYIEGGSTFKSHVISGLLKNCEQVAVFALTIDSYLEEAASQLADDGLVVQARVLDAIGSNAVEQVAEHIHKMITATASIQGLVTSQRFSPGYCDWNIVQQEMLFRTMNGSSSFIKMTDRYLMIPQKSISGIMGIGTREDDVANYNPCKTCERQGCAGRR